MKTFAIRLVILLLLVAAAAAGYTWWMGRDQGRMEPYRIYGNVDIREVDLAFRQPGRLAREMFEEGDSVYAGEVMAELDAQPYREALAFADAGVQRARAELAKMRRGNRPQEIAQAFESVRQAEAVFRNAQQEFKRQSALVKSGSTSPRVADAARAARDRAKAALASARQALALRKAGFRREDIAIAEANLSAAGAKAAQAKTALADTRLLAPSDGIVLARVREPGSMVNPSTTVYTLSLRNPVYVRAYVSESDLGRAAPGTKVTVHTDSTKKIYQGQIGFVSPRAEFTPKSVETTDLRTDLVYRVRIVVANADRNLRQGMPVTIEFAKAARGK